MLIGLFTCFLHLYLSEVQNKLVLKKRQFHKEKGGPHRPYQEDADADEDLTRPSQTCFPQGARDAGGAGEDTVAVTVRGKLVRGCWPFSPRRW